MGKKWYSDMNRIKRKNVGIQTEFNYNRLNLITTNITNRKNPSPLKLPNSSQCS